MLNEKKLEYSLRLERFWEKRSDFFALNHALEVPVLVDLNGLVVADSDVILEYLEEVYHNHCFLGNNYVERVEIRRLNNWFAHIFPQEITLPILEEKIFKRFVDGRPEPQRIREAYKRLDKQLAYINWLIQRRNWLAGEELSIADLTAAAQISVLDYFNDVPWGAYHDAKTWYMRIKSRPSFQPLLKDQVPGILPSSHYGQLDF